ncbi:Alpha/Beta hydrolase protein [Lasiosphaeria miniovina]|uniref:Alpha/Beta hydrolase protein n=1 Tax=Lasiosphaeria miniovina TaxID=1954250 RepID=A0AA40BF04_9PEZI|nr:Alpha/Beta hydrolase protein [Lasiosphaeria miniovina]KAK0733033.1 Alpha/Beta hydrolase protein [Lasiosphaeria miniovina]
MAAAVLNVPCIIVDPREPHTHTVVFLHGRGDNARHFAASLAGSRDSRGRTLADALPSFRWVFPQAPDRTLANAPPGTSWPQWFDVWNVRDFTDREDLQAVGLREAVPAVHRLLADEAALLAGRWDRIVLAGISMGGATGAHVLFNLDNVLATPGVVVQGERRLAAFLGFSSRCPFAGCDLAGMRSALGLAGDGAAPAPDHAIRNTPVLLEHCVDDPLVLVQNGRLLRDTLRGFGMGVEWKEYPGGGHWFNAPSGMDDAVFFLIRHVLGGGGNADGAEPSLTEDPAPNAMDFER